MANYSIKLYDEELLSCSAEKFLDKISIKNIHANKDHLSLFPLDLQPTEDSILHWLRRRVIPKNRAFVGEILRSLGLHSNDVLGIIDVCKGLSLNDSFWVTPSDFTGSFSDYNLYENPFSEVLSIVAYTGYGSSDRAFTTSPELTTDGMLPKAWRNINGGIYLYKGGSTGAANAGNEPYAEFYAAQLANAMGINAVSYDLDRWKGILASTCKLFTDINTAYVPMGRMGQLLHKVTLADTIEFCASKSDDFTAQLKSMLMFDALIRNEDRHFGNFGVLRDNHSGEIIAPAPLFDHGLGLFSQAFTTELQSADTLFEFANAFSPFYDNISTRDICDFAIDKKQVHQLHQLIDFHFTKHPVYNWSDERLHVTEQCIRKRAIQLYNIAKEAHKDIKVFTPSLDSSEPRRMAAQLQQAQAQKEAAQESRKPHVIISPPER